MAPQNISRSLTNDTPIVIGHLSPLPLRNPLQKRATHKKRTLGKKHLHKINTYMRFLKNEFAYLQKENSSVHGDMMRMLKKLKTLSILKAENARLKRLIKRKLVIKYLLMNINKIFKSKNSYVAVESLKNASSDESLENISTMASSSGSATDSQLLQAAECDSTTDGMPV